MKKRVKARPKEFLYGERVYSVVKSKNGKGFVYGVCYLPREYIGKKITVSEVSKNDIDMIETFPPKDTSERRLKKR